MGWHKWHASLCGAGGAFTSRDTKPSGLDFMLRDFIKIYISSLCKNLLFVRKSTWEQKDFVSSSCSFFCVCSPREYLVGQVYTLPRSRINGSKTHRKHQGARWSNRQESASLFCSRTSLHRFLTLCPTTF